MAEAEAKKDEIIRGHLKKNSDLQINNDDQANPTRRFPTPRPHDLSQDSRHEPRAPRAYSPHQGLAPVP
ncbi:hypothetical protein IMZ48_00945 [Candidatus Bathyarchaeota archaeon]|nr:hypothetical protein [Candidatus Bathyarchaeota archaeon]